MENPFSNLHTFEDYRQLEEAFQLKKQLASQQMQQLQQGGNLPASIQLANEFQKARASGDVQRMNDLLVAAKSLDKGVVTDAAGGATSLPGYGSAVAGIQGTVAGEKRQAEKTVDLKMDPAIASGVTNAKNASDLSYAAPIKQAQAEGGAIGDAKGKAKGMQAKQVAQAPEILGYLAEADKLLPSATAGGLATQIKGGAAYLGRPTNGSPSDARLRIISSKLLANVPRMEGPQSDRDVIQYQQAAGDLANTELPVEDRQAAAAMIREITQKYAKQNTDDLNDLFPTETNVMPNPIAPESPSPGSTKTSQTGTYLFNGGDPADKANWKKVK